MKRSKELVTLIEDEQVRFDTSPWKDVRCPGLTSGATEIAKLTDSLPKELSVFSYKQSQKLLWVLFLGGTGTGKSTIFNALCGEALSDTGVERPKTYGPIVYAHAEILMEGGFPFPGISIKRVKWKKGSSVRFAGDSGSMLVAEHVRDDLSHMILVDTPDLDSLEVANRRMVGDLYLLADVIVFVTSQEKYADGVPFQFLNRIQEDGKLYFLLINKAEAVLDREEVLSSLHEEGLKTRSDRFRILPYLPPDSLEQLSQHEAFTRCASDLLKTVSKSEVAGLLRSEKRKRVEKLTGDFRMLFDLLGKEKQAAARWVEQLDILFRNTCRDLFLWQEHHFAAESREYLQQEIRRLYGKYDLLGTPRRLIAQIILSPLRMLGLGSARPQETHQEAILRIRRRTDLTPVQAAIESFNRSVLEKLSPHDDTVPLFKRLRDPGILLTGSEIRKLVWENQEKLVKWLESTFERLAKGIPKSKEWGIYSTSILWGGLILSLETAIGGGISLLEAVLDSAIAPFVTKGAVELFAYRELQLVARELGERYQEGMISVLRTQRDRYAVLVRSLLTSDETLETLVSIQRAVIDKG